MDPLIVEPISNTLDWSNIIVALISSIFTLCGIWLKEHIKKSNKENISIDRSRSYIELDKISHNIRKALNADGVYIANFHNGGVFHTGKPMDKYSVVGEDYTFKLKSYKNQYQNILVNNIAYLYHNLIVQNRYYIEDIDKGEMKDKAYRDDLIDRKIKASYNFIIKDTISSKPIGFVSVEYLTPTEFPKCNEQFIWKYQNDIANILNVKSIKKII